MTEEEIKYQIALGTFNVHKLSDAELKQIFNMFPHNNKLRETLLLEYKLRSAQKCYSKNYFKEFYYININT